MVGKDLHERVTDLTDRAVGTPCHEWVGVMSSVRSDRESGPRPNGASRPG
jgi:hypothetical protein